MELTPLTKNCSIGRLQDPNRWQRMIVGKFIDKTGVEIDGYPQFVTPQWSKVRPFALKPEHQEETLVGRRFFCLNLNMISDFKVECVLLNLNFEYAIEFKYKFEFEFVIECKFECVLYFIENLNLLLNLNLNVCYLI